MLQWPRSPRSHPKNPRFSSSVSSRSVFARRCSRDTARLEADHVSLDATRSKPARQPEAVAAGLEGKRNPRDRAAGSDRLIPPAMQQSKQPFWVRLELFARLTLNAGKHAGNQPARVAQLDHGNDRAILVQGDEGSVQVIWLGHRGTPSIKCSDEVAMPRRPPIASIGPSRAGLRFSRPRSPLAVGQASAIAANGTSMTATQRRSAASAFMDNICSSTLKSWWSPKGVVHQRSTQHCAHNRDIAGRIGGGRPSLASPCAKRSRATAAYAAVVPAGGSNGPPPRSRPR